jgi:hypothetical protein
LAVRTIKAALSPVKPTILNRIGLQQLNLFICERRNSTVADVIHPQETVWKTRGLKYTYLGFTNSEIAEKLQEKLFFLKREPLSTPMDVHLPTRMIIVQYG